MGYTSSSTPSSCLFLSSLLFIFLASFFLIQRLNTSADDLLPITVWRSDAHVQVCMCLASHMILSTCKTFMYNVAITVRIAEIIGLASWSQQISKWCKPKLCWLTVSVSELWTVNHISNQVSSRAQLFWKFSQFSCTDKFHCLFWNYML